MNKRFFVLWLILISAVLVAACGPANPSAATATPMALPTTQTEIEVAPPVSTGPVPAEVAEGDFTTTETGLKYYDLIEGEGEAPHEGDIVSVNYVLWLQEGNQLIDDSATAGAPIDFVLGSEQVFPGWNEGVLSMGIGGKRQLVIPPDLGLGTEGVGIIPPDATLVLEVELVSFRTPPAPTAVDEADFTTTESGLKVYDLQVGSGEIPKTGANITMNFTIWLQEGNQYVASSEENGQPFNFVLGSGTVFPGWEEGISTMQTGGKRQLVIPPDLGLGEQGGGGVVPPNATLLMEVELLSFEQPVLPTEVEEADFTTTDSGLKYYDLVVGDGATPQQGQTMVVHYTGWLENGVKFDSSVDRNQPLEFILGTGGVIAGWDEGIATMQVGSKRQLVIPPNLAYGETGSGSTIPPNSILIFEVELLEIK